jgi:hypothetical protein
MKGSKDEIFLGKLGKIFGPFSPKEFDEMFSDGRINEYSWLWDWEKQSWKPLENTPPSLMTPPGAATPEKGGKSSATTAAPTPSDSLAWDQVEALCYGREILINGKLELITQTGCVLVSANNSGDPKLTVGVRVKLNLFDKKSKHNLETSVKVANIERKNSHWVYRLRWDGVPEL